MYKNPALFTIGVTLLLSLICVDGGYAIQIVNSKPPVDLMTVVEMNGWTEGPLQIVGILLGTGLIALIGRGLKRRLRHHHYEHQT